MIAKTIILSVSGRDPCTGIPVPEIPVQDFPEMQKKGGASISSVIRLAPPLQKPTGFFSPWSLTRKKWSGFLRAR